MMAKLRANPLSSWSDRFLQQLRNPALAKTPDAPAGGSLQQARAPLRFHAPGPLPSVRETARLAETQADFRPRRGGAH